MESGAGEKDERRREGASCVLSGIPKNLYDLNDKRRLIHALCIRHCTCTVIPIKLLAGCSSVKGRAEEDVYRK